MLDSLTYALGSAWLFTFVLGVARCMPQRANGRPAVITTAGTLLLISWAGGAWGRVLLGFEGPEPFPYVLAALLGALALAPLAVPVRLGGPVPTRRARPRRLVTIPSRSHWVLVVVLAVAVVARYCVEAMV